MNTNPTANLIVGYMMVVSGIIPIYGNPEPSLAPVSELRPRRLPPMAESAPLALVTA